jgi:hypothetical protein
MTIDHRFSRTSSAQVARGAGRTRTERVRSFIRSLAAPASGEAKESGKAA